MLLFGDSAHGVVRKQTGPRTVQALSRLTYSCKLKEHGHGILSCF